MIREVLNASSFGEKRDGREDRLRGHDSGDEELLRRKDTELKDNAGAQ